MMDNRGSMVPVAEPKEPSMQELIAKAIEINNRTIDEMNTIANNMYCASAVSNDAPAVDCMMAALQLLLQQADLINLQAINIKSKL